MHPACIIPHPYKVLSKRIHSQTNPAYWGYAATHYLQAAEEAASDAKGALFSALASFDARLETEAERWQSRSALQHEAWVEGQSEHLDAVLQVCVDCVYVLLKMCMCVRVWWVYLGGGAEQAPGRDAAGVCGLRVCMCGQVCFMSESLNPVLAGTSDCRAAGAHGSREGPAGKELASFVLTGASGCRAARAHVLSDNCYTMHVVCIECIVHLHWLT